MTYDLIGNQLTLNDPDAGLIQYQYDLLGQLTRQTDNKNQVYNNTYDILGRILTSSNTIEGTNTYTYVTSGNGLGLLSSVINSKSGISHNYSYNALARITTESELISGTAYSYNYGYDTRGRVSQITYPGGFIIKKVYGACGELKKVTDSADNPIWEVTGVSSHGELKTIQYGNGTSTQYSYDTYHHPSEIKTINAAGVIRQHLQYSFQHTTGNLTWRKDLLANAGMGITEDFTYDALDRLLTYHAGTNPMNGISYNSDGSGRFSGKSDIGKYNYGGPGGTIPHAPTSITNSSGYVMSHTQQDIAYTPFQMAGNITQGTTKLDIVYGPEHTRKKTELRNGTTLVKRKIFAGNLYELEEDAAGNKRHLYYIPGPDGEAAIFVKINSGAVTPYYIHKDYQGTYQTITDAGGNTAEVLSFDPWGRRRNATDWSYNNVPVSFLFDRGYTGHEHLDAFELINMNGRIFDPQLAHFLSPDNFVQDPGFTQSYNRYGYCLNNPLKFTDPSGYMTWRGALVSIIGTGLGILTAILTDGIVGFTVIWDDETGYWDVHIASAYSGTYGIHFGQNEDGSWHTYGSYIGNIDWSQIHHEEKIPEYDPGLTAINPVTGDEYFINSGSESYDRFVESYEYARRQYEIQRDAYYGEYLTAGGPFDPIILFPPFVYKNNLQTPSQIWNSNYFRNFIVHDKYSVSTQMGIALVKGISVNLELNLVTRGPEAGLFFTSSKLNRTGLMVDIGLINVSTGNFNGPVSEITRKSYLGPCYDWDGGYIYGGSIWTSRTSEGLVNWYGLTVGYGLTIGLTRGKGETVGPPFD